MNQKQDADHLMFEVRKGIFTAITDSDILTLSQYMLETHKELLQ